MARKKIVEESFFIDNISNIKYRWLKEETDRLNDVSCWIAEDIWGNKDHFIVSIKENEQYPSNVLKGPYKTIKETLGALQEKDEEEVVEVDVENPIVDNEEGKGYVNAGILDEIYQLINMETENIRKCQELMCFVSDEEKPNYVDVLNKVITASNANLGMLQEIAKNLSPSAVAIEDGAEEAKEILDSEEDTFNFSDEEENEEEIDVEVNRAFMDDIELPDDEAIRNRFHMDDLDDEEIKNLKF